MKSKLRFTISAIVTLIILVLILSLIDLKEVAVSLKSANISYLFIAFALIPAFVILKAYRWYFIVKLKAPIRYVDGLVSYLTGSSLGLLTPAKMGELSRVFYLPVKDKPAYAGAVIMDKVFDLLTLILLSSVGCLIVLGTEAFLVTIAAFLAIAVAILSLNTLTWFARKLKWLKNIEFLLKLGEIASMKTGEVATCFCVSLAIFGIALVQCYYIICAFQQVDPSVVLLTFPLIILSTALPVTIGGLGIRESAAVLLLGGFGISAANAFNASFTIFFLNTFIPAVVGAFLIGRIRPVPPGATCHDNLSRM